MNMEESRVEGDSVIGDRATTLVVEHGSLNTNPRDSLHGESRPTNLEANSLTF